MNVKIILTDSYNIHYSNRADSTSIDGLLQSSPINYFPLDKNIVESSKIISSLKEKVTLEEGSVDEEKRIEEQLKKNRPVHFDGGITEYITDNLIISFTAAGGATALLKFGKDVFIQWMKNRGGRSIKIKVGEFEVEIKGTNDIKKAMDVIEKIKTP